MGDRSIPILNAAEINKAEQPQRRKPKSSDPEERQLNRAATLAIQGHLSRAVSTLMRDTDVVEVSEEVKVQKLRELHPKRVELVKQCHQEDTVELRMQTVPKKNAQTSEPQLKAEIRRWCSGKAAGPSGWTEELIRDAITAENVPEWMAIFEDIINASLDSDTLIMLRRANLIGIPKKPDGIRPLAMGETLVKVAVKLLLATQKELFNSRAVGGFQYAFEKCGVEQIIHQVRELIRPPKPGSAPPSQTSQRPPSQQPTDESDNTASATAAATAPPRINHAVLVDCSNAFNTIRRQAISDVLMSDPKYNPLRKLFNAFLSMLTGLIKTRADPELQTAFTHAATINKFSKALAFGNGNCLLFSHQLRMFGVHLNAAPTTITAPPQLISAPLDLAPVVESPTDFFAPPGHSKSDAIDVEEDDDDEATAEENTRPAPTSSQAPLARPPPMDAPPAETPPPVRVSFRVKMLTATDLAPPQQQHAPPPAPPPTHPQQVTYAPSQAYAQPSGPAPPQGNTQANARAPHMDRTPLPTLPTTATTGATNPVAPAASAWQTPLERTRFQAPAGMQAAARNRVLNLSSK